MRVKRMKVEVKARLKNGKSITTLPTTKVPKEMCHPYNEEHLIAELVDMIKTEFPDMEIDIDGEKI
jgi:hypothetical protein